MAGQEWLAEITHGLAFRPALKGRRAGGAVGVRPPLLVPVARRRADLFHGHAVAAFL
jgi:hypothetical protein